MGLFRRKLEPVIPIVRFSTRYRESGWVTERDYACDGDDPVRYAIGLARNSHTTHWSGSLYHDREGPHDQYKSAWFGNPDPSTWGKSDTIVSMHLYGFSDSQLKAIIAAINTPLGDPDAGGSRGQPS